jgi:WD40 repeat protein
MDNVVKLWNLALGQEVATLKGHQTEIGAVAFSPDGKTLASRSLDGVIKLWRAPTFAEIAAREHASQRQAARGASPADAARRQDPTHPLSRS